MLGTGKSTTHSLTSLTGILVAYCFSIATRELNGTSATSGSWRIVCALNILWALILGIGILFAPESPRWLIAHDKHPEAEKALADIRGVSVSDNDISVKASYTEIEDALAEERETPKVGWLGCFNPKKKTLYRTLLGMVCSLTIRLGDREAEQGTKVLASWPAADWSKLVRPYCFAYCFVESELTLSCSAFSIMARLIYSDVVESVS